MTTKEQFLIEHNKLSSEDMRATMDMLARFEEAKPAIIKGDDWPIEKIRRPFIFWLTSLTQAEKDEIRTMQENAQK